MKKLFSLIAVAILALTGCGSDNGTVGTDEPVTLSVMGWSFGTEDAADTNISRQVVAAYEEANPNVTIEIIAPPEGEDYNEYLNSLVASGDVPDVFMYSSHATPVTQGWAMDVSDIVKGNETYKNIVPALTEGGEVNGKVYGIPTNMSSTGIYQNLDILEEKNITPLEPGYTMDDLVANIEAATDDSTKGFDAFSTIVDWYPAMIDSNLQWFNFDGETYDFNNEAFVQAVDLANEICAGEYSMECPGDDFVIDGDWAVSSGQVAYFQTQTNWDVANDTGQNFQYIGMPEGNTVLIPDYMYVSSETEFPEQAVDFITYYGANSYQQRADFVAENGGFLTPPILNNDEYKDTYFSFVEGAGYPELEPEYENSVSDSGVIVEALKVIPSYSDARYNTLTGITNEETGEEYTMGTLMTDIAKGKVSLADYADDLNELAANAKSQTDALMQ